MSALFVLCLSMEAEAQELFHSSRARLLIHAGYDVSEKVRLEFRGVPSFDLMQWSGPILFLGPKMQVTDWLGVEIYGGYMHPQNDALVSLSLNPHHGRFYAWTATDVLVRTRGGYVFALADYRVTDWVHAGIEMESWGNWENFDTWSIGAGPNVLLKFGWVGLDCALHIRRLEEEVAPEFSTRIHLSPQK